MDSATRRRDSHSFDNDEFVLPDHLNFFEGETDPALTAHAERSSSETSPSWLSEELAPSHEAPSRGGADPDAMTDSNAACIGFTHYYKYLLPERGLRLPLDLLPTVLFSQVPSAQCMFLTDAKGHACVLPRSQISFASVCDEILKRRNPTTANPLAEGYFCLAHYRNGTVQLLTRARFEVLCAMSGLNPVAGAHVRGASFTAFGKGGHLAEHTNSPPWAIQAYEMPLNDEYYVVTYTAEAGDEQKLATFLQVSANCKVSFFLCRVRGGKRSSQHCRVSRVEIGGLSQFLLTNRP
jgi:hypothetical protein